MRKKEEITKLKKTALSLHNHIESHTCTFFLPSGNEDPVAQISQLTTELKMAKRDRKKAQTNLETTMKIMQAKEGVVSKLDKISKLLMLRLKISRKN